jgi:hypothetical protein
LDARITAIRGTAQGQDGLITAVVDGRSELVELAFEPKAMRLPAEDPVAAMRDTVNAPPSSSCGRSGPVTPPPARRCTASTASTSGTS